MNTKWSDEELLASVEAFIDMYSKELAKIPFNKKAFYRILSERFGRTEKAFEYRMQNISYVFTLMGRPFLKGLKPAKNVGGEKMVNKLKEMILLAESKIETDLNEMKSEVHEPDAKYNVIPEGALTPQLFESKAIRYKRLQQVKNYVLNKASGICENCSNQAPFITKAGVPYLETHHVKQVAHGGSDTIENGIAVCPNCHKEFHHGKDSAILIDNIYSKIARLKRE